MSTTTPSTAASRRAARRENRRAERVARVDGALGARPPQIEYQLKPLTLLGDDAVRQIHDASMHILSKLGIAFYDEECREILAAHGARVEGDLVFLEEATVMGYIGKAPAEFTQLARNPSRSVTVGGARSIFAPVYGPPFVYDRVRGRREGTLDDFENFVKLAYLSPYLHHSGGTVCEPNDEPVPTRHLDMLLAHIRLSDKPFMGSVTEPQNAADSVALAQILFGDEEMRAQTALLSLINVSSPRRYDERMLGCIKVYARARQAMIITPFLMAGAMSPAAVGGTLALQNAEALAGIALVQMIEPGCPVVYGSFMTNLDLQSGATVFGSPESQLTIFAVSQLARRYGLPFRTGGMFTSSKLDDAQSGYESVQTMLPAVQAQTNFVLHSAGWLESGLVSGYEKFVLDCELLGMYHTWAKGLDLSDEGLALDALAEVEAGGHFLGTAHTMRHFRTAFHRPDTSVLNYDAFEQWTINGAEDAATRATKKWRALLSEYEAPALEMAVEEELREFVAGRKRDLGF